MNMDKYSDVLINKIYKILPLVEKDRQGAKKYIDSLVVELKGACENFDNNPYMMSILFSIEGLQKTTDYNVVRSKIFECISMINKIKAGEQHESP